MDNARVKEILFEAIEADGRLSGPLGRGEVLAFNPGDNAAYLDGDFTTEQLEAVIAHMRAHGSK